jgi:hypothetical protein
MEDFLESLLTKVRTNTLSCEERIHLSHFYAQRKTMDVAEQLDVEDEYLLSIVFMKLYISMLSKD